MKSFSLMVCLFFLAATPSKAQVFIGDNYMNVVAYPTCDNANGSVYFTDSVAAITDFVALYTYPDSVLIGTGTSYSGLKQGYYMTKRIRPNGYVEWNHHFLSSFRPLDYQKFLNAFTQSILPDTCSLSKGRIRLAWSQNQALRDTLNMVQWIWSNGQTGLNVSGLKAGQDYWVRGSFGAGCPYYIPYTFNSYLFADSLNEIHGYNYKFRKLRIHNDTLFFSIINGNTLNVGFTDIVKPLCETPTGKLTAVLYNSGTPPYQWKWNTGATGSTLQNVKSGYYGVKVSDAAGCNGLNNFYLYSQNPAGYQVTIEENKKDSCLFGLGKIVAHVQGGRKPYKYKWEYYSPYTDDSIGVNLKAGSKQIQVLDSNGCRLSKYFQLLNKNPLVAGTSIEQPDCSGQLGKITISGVGGVAPYHAAWAGYPNDPSLVFDSLTPGTYNGYLVDANGCRTQVGAHLSVPTSCYRRVTLDVFRDENGDCKRQNTELPIMNPSVRYKVLNTYYYSQGYGSYNSFDVLPGVQDISLYRIPHFTPACIDTSWNIQNVVISANQNNLDTSIGLNVAIPRKNCLSKMWVRWNNAFRPGFNTNFTISIRNDGNQVISNPALLLTLPEDVSFQSCDYPYTITAPGKIKIQLGLLPLGDQISFPVVLKLASTVPLNVSIPFEIDMDTLDGESILSDNKARFSFISVGAFDPNDISVSPSPVIKPSETLLEYQIRFQNLGTYYAENVVLIDTLPDNIDPSTFRVGYTNYRPTSVEIKGRVLTVRYVSIYLLPAIFNEPASHGVFSYTVNRYPNLPLGTKIRNSASIYFDFNTPVKTNVSEVEVNETTTSVQDLFSIYPNPGAEYVKVIGSSASEMDVFDVTGKQLIHLNSSANGRFSLESVPDGLYFLRFREGGKFHSLKLMVQKN